MSADLAQEANDRLQIMELLHRSATAYDQKNGERLRSCYLPDVVVVIDGEELRGEDFFDPTRLDQDGRIRRATGGDAGVDQGEMSTHAVSDIIIDLHGDSADVESACVVFLVGVRGTEPVMLVRGIRYNDRVVKNDGQWKIAHRVHRFRWMFESKPTKVSYENT